MKKMLAVVFMLFVSVMMVVNDAEAKRFGGGRSFGVSRQTNSYNYSRARQQTAPVQNPATNSRSWLGPLAGLAAGGLLASLFMGHGFGGGVMSLLMVGAGLLMLFALFRRLLRPLPTAAGASGFNMFQQAAPNAQQSSSGYQAQGFNSVAPDLPPGFNEMEFLRKAKVLFIRMQAAYDQKNLDDLMQFTVPDVFAEIKMQLQERGDTHNQTDVVSLDAELLDASVLYREESASVRFTGMIKEDRDSSSVAINEVWHFRKSPNSDVWQVAGVQQE